MKKFLSMLICINMIFALIACNFLNQNTNTSSEKNNVGETDNVEFESKFEKVSYYNAFSPEKERYPLIAKTEMDYSDNPAVAEYLGNHVEYLYYFVYDKESRLEYLIMDSISDTVNSSRSITHYVYDSKGNILHIYGYYSERTNDEGDFSIITFKEKTDYTYSDNLGPSTYGEKKYLENINHSEVNGYYYEYKFWYDNQGLATRGMYICGGNDGDLPVNNYQYFYDSNGKWIETELCIGDINSTYKNETGFDDPVSEEANLELFVELSECEVLFVDSFENTHENYKYISHFDEMGYVLAKAEDRYSWNTHKDEMGDEGSKVLPYTMEQYYSFVNNEDYDNIKKIYKDISENEINNLKERAKSISSIEWFGSYKIKAPFADEYIIYAISEVKYNGYENYPTQNIECYYVSIDKEGKAFFKNLSGDDNKIMNEFFCEIDSNSKDIQQLYREVEAYNKDNLPQELLVQLGYIKQESSQQNSLNDNSELTKESIISDDIQTADSKIYETNRSETKIVGKEYTAPFGSELIKQGEDYYLYPPLYDNILCARDNWTEYIPFDEPLHISKDAEIGLTKDIEIEFNGEWDEYIFVYEYNDFYKMIDKLIDDNRWQIDEYNMLYFEYKGNRIGAYPIIILDENGDIIMFKEYADQMGKYL